MKKTVTLTSLIKAKNDLELFIKIDQMSVLKKLFNPTFDLKDLNTKIESKEDQLIKIKVAIQDANANNDDEEGNPINYSIYLLSKYNRFKSDLLTRQNRLNSDEFLSTNLGTKQSLLGEIEDLNALIEKDTDKKVKAEHLSAKNKLKRSLSKVSLEHNKSHTDKLLKEVAEDLSKTEVTIAKLKNKLTELNNSISVEVDVTDEFEIIVK